MRCLRARRHRSGCACTRAGGAVTDREHGGIARRLQCRLDDQLIDAIDLQTVEAPQDLWRFDTCRPYDKLRVDEGAVGQAETLLRDLRRLGTGVNLDPEVVEKMLRGLGDALR